MKKKMKIKNKILITCAIIIITSIVISTINIVNKKDFKDTISYNGNTYVLLEYNNDIFTYYFNSNTYYEQDMIHPIKHDKWNMVYFDGDLFIIENEVNKAKKYYSNDNNYEWYFVIDTENDEEEYKMTIKKEELEFIYDLENIKKEETIIFDDIKNFGSIKKVSKDKTVFGSISLAYINNNWYWKSEIMTDDDREYVIKLPQSLNEKINNLIK